MIVLPDPKHASNKIGLAGSRSCAPPATDYCNTLVRRDGCEWISKSDDLREWRWIVKIFSVDNGDPSGGKSAVTVVFYRRFTRLECYKARRRVLYISVYRGSIICISASLVTAVNDATTRRSFLTNDTAHSRECLSRYTSSSSEVSSARPSNKGTSAHHGFYDNDQPTRRPTRILSHTDCFNVHLSPSLSFALSFGESVPLYSDTSVRSLYDNARDSCLSRRLRVRKVGKKIIYKKFL